MTEPSRGDRRQAGDARAILADAQAEALDLINAILYDLALTMPGASVPEVIAVLPGPEQEAVHELIGALG